MSELSNHKIFSINEHNFKTMAMEVFRFQYDNNEVYRQFANILTLSPANVPSLQDIPFLPIAFFKSHPVKSTNFLPETVFESSGTTKNTTSRHFVKAIELYKTSFLRAFNIFYGDPRDYCVIGLLPSYLERGNSSLTFMVDELIRRSHHPYSGFYLDEFDSLAKVLEVLERNKQKTLLIGVTFALLDFAERHTLSLEHTIIMETGGMKGRREELTRQQVHNFLRERLGVNQVHSEYGMTELLSQAYSKGEGVFYCPPWMRVLLREEDDPLELVHTPAYTSQSGVINVIDLANIYSCSFIATDDVGRLTADGGFEVLGRMDNSDIRGCSLMVI